ncbi:MAG: osmosensitive channel histidine kinase [Deltaproteobacteria bacterium]|nr:osmosensitive channel histidine kinase [Deltaproteobacteria bacterium]
MRTTEHKAFELNESIQGHIALFGSPLKYYAWAVISVSIVTLIGEILTPYFDLVNIVLLYLLPVLVSAVRWGRGPSFFSSFLGVFTFNFFFVPPIFTFAVANMEHLFVLIVFFLVALVTSTMATKLRNELEKTTEREKRTLILYALSRDIAAKADLEQVLKTFVDKVAESINGLAIVLIQDPIANVLRQMAATGDNTVFDEKEYAVARWVLEHGQPAGKGLGIFEGERSMFFFPIKGEDKTLAVLGIRPNIENATLSPEQRQLIETFTNLAAVAIVRLQLAKDAEQAKWLAESERLHRTLLNSISHDFRTPLASITGAVTSLLAEGSVYTQEAKAIFLHTIREEAYRLNRFIENLLDMVRLESGTLKLNMKWCDIQDIIGVVFRETRDTLQGHPLWIDIPPDPPSIKADFILIEQVIINLLENAVKYSPPDSAISISAHCKDKILLITVADIGPPIPKAEQEHVFDKFYRLHSAKHVSGTGLGLSICKGIIEAHGGSIWVDSSPEYGNRFTFSLPVSEELSEQQFASEGTDHVC